MIKFVKSNDAGYPEPISAIAAAGTYKVGTALYNDGGVLKPAAGDVKAVCITQEDRTLAAEGVLLVYPITPGMVFETQLSAFSASSQKQGSRVTISTDGRGITATAAGSTAGTGALIIDMRGAAKVGDTVWVRLRY